MGFGILFFGYLITFFLSMTSYGFLIRLIGYSIMTLALLKLREYGRVFTLPLGVSFFMIAYGIYDFVVQGAGKLDIVIPSFFEKAAPVMEWIDFTGVMALNLCLLYSIVKISTRLDLPKIRSSAIRNGVFVIAYIVFSLLCNGPFRSNEAVLRYLAFPRLLIQLIWIILNLVLIYSCYMYICPAGDEDMPRKKTKIGFVDRMLEESDRRMDVAAKETNDYIKKKRAERMAREEIKKSKKK